jgi:hypothetical protein
MCMLNSYRPMFSYISDVLCKCASVSGTEVQLLCVAMCCWEMQSVTDSSYTGTVIVCSNVLLGNAISNR